MVATLAVFGLVLLNVWAAPQQRQGELLEGSAVSTNEALPSSTESGLQAGAVDAGTEAPQESLLEGAVPSGHSPLPGHDQATTQVSQVVTIGSNHLRPVSSRKSPAQSRPFGSDGNVKNFKKNLSRSVPFNSLAGLFLFYVTETRTSDI